MDKREMEERWKKDGRKMEERWKEERWKEERWKKDVCEYKGTLVFRPMASALLMAAEPVDC